MTDFKTKMAELAAKYHISHKRDIDWHNFVAEVEELTEEQPEKDCDELMESSRALYDDIDFCIIELLRARREGNEQHERKALSRMESLMVATQQQLCCIVDYLEKEQPSLPSELDEAAIDFADNARKQLYSKDYAIASIADYDHGCIDGFKAGAEWAMNHKEDKR